MIKFDQVKVGDTFKYQDREDRLTVTEVTPSYIRACIGSLCWTIPPETWCAVNVSEYKPANALDPYAHRVTEKRGVPLFDQVKAGATFTDMHGEWYIMAVDHGVQSVHCSSKQHGACDLSEADWNRRVHSLCFSNYCEPDEAEILDTDRLAADVPTASAWDKAAVWDNRLAAEHMSTFKAAADKVDACLPSYGLPAHKTGTVLGDLIRKHMHGVADAEPRTQPAPYYDGMKLGDTFQLRERGERVTVCALSNHRGVNGVFVVGMVGVQCLGSENDWNKHVRRRVYQYHRTQLPHAPEPVAPSNTKHMTNRELRSLAKPMDFSSRVLIPPTPTPQTPNDVRTLKQAHAYFARKTPPPPLGTCPFCASTSIHQETVDVGVGMAPVGPLECNACGSGQDRTGTWIEHPDRKPTDAEVAKLQAVLDANYCARQEAEKQKILAEWRQPWRPGTNGVGSIPCVMFKEGRKL